MNNERRIKPLMRYEVTVYDAVIGEGVDTFTAESHEIKDGHRTVFYNTGHIIREYQVPLKRIVATPIDDEQVSE